MAKTTKTEDNSPKNSYAEEDMSETEEYFQKVTRTNNHNKKASICSFAQDNASNIDNDATICHRGSQIYYDIRYIQRLEIRLITEIRHGIIEDTSRKGI